MIFPIDLVKLIRNFLINGILPNGNEYQQFTRMKIDGEYQPQILTSTFGPFKYRIKFELYGARFDHESECVCMFQWNKETNKVNLSIKIMDAFIPVDSWELISADGQWENFNRFYGIGGLIDKLSSWIISLQGDDTLDIPLLLPGHFAFYSRVNDAVDGKRWISNMRLISDVNYPKYYYESLGMTNCYAYCDIDYVPLENMRDTIEKIYAAYKRMFMECFNEVILTDNIKLLRSFPDKPDKSGELSASFHVIVRSIIVFPEPMSVKAYMEPYFTDIKYDKSVYAFLQKMRTPLSEKNPQDIRIFKPVSLNNLNIPLDVSIDEYQIQTLNQSIIKTSFIDDLYFANLKMKFTNERRTAEEWKEFDEMIDRNFNKMVSLNPNISRGRHLASMFKSFENSANSFRKFEHLLQSRIEECASDFNEILNPLGKASKNLLYKESATFHAPKLWKRSIASPYHTTIEAIEESIQMALIYDNTVHNGESIEIMIVKDGNHCFDLDKFLDQEFKYFGANIRCVVERHNNAFYTIIIVPGNTIISLYRGTNFTPFFEITSTTMIMAYNSEFKIISCNKNITIKMEQSLSLVIRSA